MFGCIVVAAAATYGAITFVRGCRRRRSRGPFDGGGGARCGRGPWGHELGGSRYGRAGVRRHFLRGVFTRLEATPAQERVILEAAEALEGAVAQQAEAARAWRGALAQAFDGAKFDRAGIDSFFAEQEKALAELRSTVAGKLATVHESLEPDQRGAAARMIRNFGAWHRHW